MKNYIILALAFTLGGSIHAQPGAASRDTATSREERQERKAEMRVQMERQKIAFITSEVKMTPEEGQKFWPIYNAFQAEKEALVDREFRSWRGRSEAEVTAEELDARMEAKFAIERKRIDMDERYYAQYKKVLPADKLAAYYRAEKDFKRELMREMRSRGETGARGGYRGGQMEMERSLNKRDEMRVTPED